jgi:hypothetical protein
MIDSALEKMRDLVQEDVGRRGLRTHPDANLISAAPGDFSLACRSIAGTSRPVLAVVTGFLIVDAEPPSAETDGPLGALFLARALCPLGIKVILLTDAFCRRALEAGLEACSLSHEVPVVEFPVRTADFDQRRSKTEGGRLADAWDDFDSGPWANIRLGGTQVPPLTHLLALERVGPGHTLESIRRQAGGDLKTAEEYERDVPAARRGRCLNMRGQDVSDYLAPAERLFEQSGPPKRSFVTLGIGDGGNEIGMGKIPWSVIRRNIPQGGQIACRVPTDYLIVAGLSNWGAYGLAAGVRLLRGAGSAEGLFEADIERELLEIMVSQGPLVDGVTRRPRASVDGLEFPGYAEPLRTLGKWLE